MRGTGPGGEIHFSAARRASISSAERAVVTRSRGRCSWGGDRRSRASREPKTTRSRSVRRANGGLTLVQTVSGATFDAAGPPSSPGRSKSNSVDLRHRTSFDAAARYRRGWPGALAQEAYGAVTTELRTKSSRARTAYAGESCTDSTFGVWGGKSAPTSISMASKGAILSVEPSVHAPSRDQAPSLETNASSVRSSTSRIQ